MLQRTAIYNSSAPDAAVGSRTDSREDERNSAGDSGFIARSTVVSHRVVTYLTPAAKCGIARLAGSFRCEFFAAPSASRGIQEFSLALVVKLLRNFWGVKQ